MRRVSARGTPLADGSRPPRIVGAFYRGAVTAATRPGEREYGRGETRKRPLREPPSKGLRAMLVYWIRGPARNSVPTSLRGGLSTGYFGQCISCMVSNSRHPPSPGFSQHTKRTMLSAREAQTLQILEMRGRLHCASEDTTFPDCAPECRRVRSGSSIAGSWCVCCAGGASSRAILDDPKVTVMHLKNWLGAQILIPDTLRAATTSI